MAHYIRTLVIAFLFLMRSLANITKGSAMENSKTEEKIPPIHPGEILMEEFLKPMKISQYRLAKEINVTPIRISEIIHGKRAITADTAIRLGKFFDMTPQFWLGLQMEYDLEIEREQIRSEDLERIGLYTNFYNSTSEYNEAEVETGNK